MNILNIITGGIKLDGITISQIENLKNFDLNSINVDFVVSESSNSKVVDEIKSLGGGIKLLPDRRKELFSYVISLFKLLKKNKYDIIHVHGSSAILSIELILAKLAGVKVRIAHSRNTTCDNIKIHKLLKPIFNKSYTHAFACGQDAGEWLFEDKKFSVIHNGKSFSRFKFSNDSREEARKKFELQDKIVLGHVGNFNNQKNHQYLVKAFYHFHQKHTNSVLYLMGEGRLRNEVESLVESLDLKDHVIFTGSVSDVDYRLQAMDIMVLPSLYEGLPTVVLEWQAVGLPCLISDKITKECSPSDLVEYMSIELPPEEWSNKISQMLEQKRNRALDAKMATKRLREENFDIEINAQKMQQMYIDFVNETKRKNR